MLNKRPTSYYAKPEDKIWGVEVRASGRMAVVAGRGSLTYREAIAEMGKMKADMVKEKAEHDRQWAVYDAEKLPTTPPPGRRKGEGWFAYLFGWGKHKVT